MILVGASKTVAKRHRDAMETAFGDAAKKPAKIKGTPDTSAIYGNQDGVENELPK